MSPAQNDDLHSPGPAGTPTPAKVGGEGIGPPDGSAGNVTGGLACDLTGGEAGNTVIAQAGFQAGSMADSMAGPVAGDEAASGAAAPVDDQGQGARIYGKQGCPHTQRARAALPRARFVDVLADPAALPEMLRLSGGARRVPVIVRSGEHGDVVQIGFKRGA